MFTACAVHSKWSVHLRSGGEGQDPIALEMLHDNALYKFNIDIDTDKNLVVSAKMHWNYSSLTLNQWFTLPQ